MGRPKPKPRSRKHYCRIKYKKDKPEVLLDGIRIVVPTTNDHMDVRVHEPFHGFSDCLEEFPNTDSSVTCKYSFNNALVEQDTNMNTDSFPIQAFTCDSTENLLVQENHSTSGFSERLAETNLFDSCEYAFTSSVGYQNVDITTHNDKFSMTTASSNPARTTALSENFPESRDSVITSDFSESISHECSCDVIPIQINEVPSQLTFDLTENLIIQENHSTSDFSQRLAETELFDACEYSFTSSVGYKNVDITTRNDKSSMTRASSNPAVTSAQLESFPESRENVITSDLPESISHDQTKDHDSTIDDNVPTEESSIQEFQVDGRRIVAITYCWQELHKNLDDHNCPFKYLKIIGEFNRGLRTRLLYECQKCRYRFHVWTDPDDKNIMGINESAVCGSITSGTVHSLLEEQLSAMSIPFMVPNTYIKYRNQLYEHFHEALETERKRAAKIEREIAIAKGHVIDGIPFIKVIADGCWSKRSYAGGRHDALSGAAMIFGYESQLALFVGVRNKYCATHERARILNKEPAEHKCYKNWGDNQPSTAMETSIISEGFKTSIEDNGLIYKVLIADGDSSVYQAIRDANPYAKQRVVVQKVECNNHLFRNLSKKLNAASQLKLKCCPTKGTSTVTELRQLISQSGLKIRRWVESARDLRKTESTSDEAKSEQLCRDIFLILNHAFGEHHECSFLPFDCAPTPNEKNAIAELHSTGVWPAIYEAVRYLSGHAKSLLTSATNNVAEACNSIVNKKISSKRINHSSTNSYNMRCFDAILQFNTQSVASRVHEQKGTSVPSTITKLEHRRQQKNEYNKVSRRNRLRRVRRKFATTDKHYGPSAQKPDLDEEVYNVLVSEHFLRLKSHQSNWQKVERDTVSQASSELWHQLRTEIITASKFGPICRMLPKTSCESMVKNIRYPKIVDTPAMRFGRDNEETARQQLALRLGKEIHPCGLFIDQEIPYLGASPDGLIDDDGIVEIKCPFSAKDTVLKEAIEKKSNLKRIFDKNDIDSMNQTHAYYYQVQGQLHITKRDYCVFVLWTSVDMKIVTVSKDDQFWESKMMPSLSRFYMDCLLPEIVDSRRNRNMPIRNPKYRLQAHEEALKRRAEKQACEQTLLVPKKKKEKSCADSHDTIETVDLDVVSPWKKEKKTDGHDWVTIESDDEVDVSGHKAELLEILRQNISAKEVIPQVLSPTSLLNDSSIDLFQNILQENSAFRCNPASYTAFYTCIEPCPREQEDLQIIGGNKSMHWICVHYDATSVFVFDSLNCLEYILLNEECKRYLDKRYPHVNSQDICLEIVTRQPDSFSCGVYAAAFATTIALGNSPTTYLYSRDAARMRSHLATILVSRKLSEFPQDSR